MALSNAERQARHRVKKLAETRAARAAVVTAEQSRRRVQAMIEEMANTRYVAGAQRAIGSIILDRGGTDPFGFAKKALEEVKKNTPLLWSDIFELIEQAGFNHWNRYLQQQSEDVFFVEPTLDMRQRQRRRAFLTDALKNLDRFG
jgi:hypothetical protein